MPVGFEVNPGTLAFSVTIFCIEAVACIAILVARRHPRLGGGELGGPRGFKIATSIFMAGLWFIYVLFASLESYCVIQGF